MKKLILALVIFYSSGSFASTLTSLPIDVKATVNVLGPSAVSASWIPSPINSGHIEANKPVGHIEITGMKQNNGAFLYSKSGDASLENGNIIFTFTGPHDNKLKTKVIPSDLDGSMNFSTLYAFGLDGSGIMLAPGDTAATFALLNGQTLGPGNYTASVTVAVYAR